LLVDDTYKTIISPSPEVAFKDKGSKFLGYVYPLEREAQVKEYVEVLKKKHHKARHWCYAWQLGIEKIHFRINDDGEPNNSAGQPIYGQILSKEVRNVLVVVVRYFGGTKLGVGGLVNAYKTTAQLSLEASNIVIKTVTVRFKLIFEYADINKVMRIIKEYQLLIESKKMELHCEYEVAVRKREKEKIQQVFESLQRVKTVLIENE